MSSPSVQTRILSVGVLSSIVVLTTVQTPAALLITAAIIVATITVAFPRENATNLENWKRWIHSFEINSQRFACPNFHAYIPRFSYSGYRPKSVSEAALLNAQQIAGMPYGSPGREEVGQREHQGKHSRKSAEQNSRVPVGNR